MGPLFQPFRALGYITDDLPFAVQRRGRESFVTVSVGKAWQVYNCAKLTLVLVGPQLRHSIRALACKGDLTFAATGNEIVECRRVHRSGVYSGHMAPVLQLMCLGDQLLSLSSDGRLLIWNIGEYDEPQRTLELGTGEFKPTCMAHPDTYLNKVVVGGENGRMQLWNFITGKLIHEFGGFQPASTVKCITSSPALDVVGIGLADGRAVLYNLKFAEAVASFANASGLGANSDMRIGDEPTKGAGGSACTAISFRTGVGVPLMAAGGGAGVITVWNLEERRIQTVIKDAHDAPLLSLHFFPGEPLLMSSAADNAIKQWVFDTAEGSARLLRFRSGHAAPPANIQYYGDGTRLLSAGQDRAFRLFSTIQDQQSRELSQGHTARRAKRLRIAEQELKLPRVVGLAACQVRERDWCNVITAHEGDPAAYTWLLKNFSIGDHVLRPPGKVKPESPVTSVAISSCGNFGMVGTAEGRIDRYNMQSGIHRGTYQRGGEGASTSNAHAGAVTGLSVDACNRLLVSAGFDGALRLWDFKRRRLSAVLEVGVPVTRLCQHANSALLALACDDLSIRMYDVEAKRLVRHFRGHSDRITDLRVSDDCRWLLSASMDGTVRVWDIPAGRVLQVMRLGSPVTALTLSPSTDMLATTHVNRRGIYLWSNQLIFGGGADVLPSEQPVDVRLPTVSTGRGSRRDGGEGDDVSEKAGTSASSDDDDWSDSEDREDGTPAATTTTADREQQAERRYGARDGAGAPRPIAPTLVTLSMLPRPQWQGLVHLDAVKARNKPQQPPKKPEAAPFFLPTLAGLQGNPVFDTAASSGGSDVDGAAAAGKSRVLGARDSQQLVSEFVRLLRAGADSSDHTSLVAHLRGMAPSAVDQELNAMQVLEGAEQEELDDLARLLDFVDAELAANRNFEFVQAFLRVLLQVHGDAIMSHATLRERAVQLERRLQQTWSRVDDLVQSVRCMVNYFGNLQG